MYIISKQLERPDNDDQGTTDKNTTPYDVDSGDRAGDDMLMLLVTVA
jgi:hypothetical protein